ncbi:MAG: nucleotide exchange factor GrpE [Chitinophagaceae bacterium]
MEEKEVRQEDTQPENPATFAEAESTIEKGIGEGEDKLAHLEKELEEQKLKYVRLYADFDNFRKQSNKQRLEYMQTAGKDVIVGLLEILDDMERAEKMINGSDNIDAIRQGLDLVFHKFRTYLHAKGLKEMESVGKDFDPELHEAISEVPVPGSEGKVIDQVEKGYLLNEKIIRFAKVVVGKQ